MSRAKSSDMTVERSELVKAKPTSRSMKTTVPIYIVKMLDLQEDDALLWHIDEVQKRVEVTKEAKKK